MGCEVVLEEWGCASEIKQILNKIKATPCEVINFDKFWNFGKVCVVKSDTSEDSEDIGEVRKRGGRIFDEKRV